MKNLINNNEYDIIYVLRVEKRRKKEKKRVKKVINLWRYLKRYCVEGYILEVFSLFNNFI